MPKIKLLSKYKVSSFAKKGHSILSVLKLLAHLYHLVLSGVISIPTTTSMVSLFFFLTDW